LGNGDGTFAPARNWNVGNSPTSVSVADFNGDSILDLAVTDEDQSMVAVLVGLGDGTFATAQNFGVGSRPSFVIAGDLNEDKLPDIAIANSGAASVTVLLNNTPHSARVNRRASLR
jgi:hypothetical protein